MASTAGRLGKIRIGGTAVVKIKNWTLDIDRGVLNDSELGVGWEENISGIGSWTGSFESAIDPGDTGGQLALINALLNGTATSGIEFITDDSPMTGSKKGFTGNCLVNTLGVGVAYDEIESGSFSITGNGAIAYSATLS
jgi:hypothetical protein